MGILRWICAVWIVLAATTQGHLVSQLFGEWKADHPWSIEVLFDAGYAVPAWRGDKDTPPPTRDWLVKMDEARWAPLRIEAERYLRESLVVHTNGQALSWRVEFPDFEKSPPDFPNILNNGAYFRISIIGQAPLSAGSEIAWQEGERPTFVLKVSKANEYLTLRPGQREILPSSGTAPPMRNFLTNAFYEGFRHVLPLGLDHILFILGLFFYNRAWRPLLSQSLAFTVAHTITLGLAASGNIRISSQWVEPLIALSLVIIAAENLRADPRRSSGIRLLIVFAFGLIHGVGFASALSAWLTPETGFFPALICANLGVEVAQTTILAAAFLLTIRWHSTHYYRYFRLAGCIAIAVTGIFWTIQRLDWLMQ